MQQNKRMRGGGDAAAEKSKPGQGVPALARIRRKPAIEGHCSPAGCIRIAGAKVEKSGQVGADRNGNVTKHEK